MSPATFGCDPVQRASAAETQSRGCTVARGTRLRLKVRRETGRTDTHAAGSVPTEHPSVSPRWSGTSMAASKSGYEGKMAGLYDLDRTLGKGHFAVVKLARHVFTGQLVAVKVIDKTKLDAVATGHLLQEVRCMKLVQHPNVVRLYEVIDTQTKLYLILELGDGGDMYDYILRHEGGVSEDQAKVHFAQIVHAISYCHRLHVVHRDLKPENVVFFRQQGVVKLTDFGFSNRFQPGTMLMTSCGSLAYSAPEILLGEEYDAPAVDVWSLGVILYMLVCGHPPFQEANDSETLTMIMDCKYTVPPHVSQDCRDLISRMLQRDPAERASLAQIESHPWLKGVDPSPAGRGAIPLTSHRSLSQEEHEAILQAMTSGNIADRDTIQEALDTDRYNHITATYYLLGEQILRDKQEPPGHSKPPLELRRLSAPVRLCGSGSQPSGEGSAGVPCKTAMEQQGAGLPVTPVRNVGALQQICEEEEEEEEEEREEEVGPAQCIVGQSVRGTMATQDPEGNPTEVEQRQATGVEDRGAVTPLGGLDRHHVAPGDLDTASEAETLNTGDTEELGSGRGGDDVGSAGETEAQRRRRLLLLPPLADAQVVSAVQEAPPTARPHSFREHNSSGSKARGRSVDLGPEGGGVLPGLRGPWSRVGPADGTPCRAKPKSARLRERLLQLPLWSLNLQPTSKEKIVPLAQYNCCRVL
ncbi:SNF-related serine/threonine-protein kinase-like [Arapaima gigas]